MAREAWPASPGQAPQPSTPWRAVKAGIRRLFLGLHVILGILGLILSLLGTLLHFKNDQLVQFVFENTNMETENESKLASLLEQKELIFSIISLGCFCLTLSIVGFIAVKKSLKCLIGLYCVLMCILYTFLIIAIVAINNGRTLQDERIDQMMSGVPKIILDTTEKLQDELTILLVSCLGGTAIVMLLALLLYPMDKRAAVQAATRRQQGEDKGGQADGRLQGDGERRRQEDGVENFGKDTEFPFSPSAPPDYEECMA